MTERGTETGTDGADAVAERMDALLEAFQERFDRLEDGLSAQVDGVRGSAAAIDLTPVTSALAEVLEAVALQSETARADRRALQDDVETLRSELRDIQGPVDLGPIERRLAALNEAITDRTPEPDDLSELHDHLDRLAAHVTASAPRPVDLAGVTSSIVGLHQRIDALIQRPDVDLGPVEDRLSSLADRAQIDELQARIGALDGRIGESRSDLTPVLDRLDALAQAVDGRADLAPIQERLDELTNTAGTTELGNRLDEVGRRIDGLDSRLDLAPIQHALAEVVDALAQQIDDSRSSSANSLAAIEVLADRVRESRADLQPVRERLAGLADAVQVDDLRQRVDEVAALAGQHPAPVDLTPLSAAIADLRTHIADSRPDFEAIRASIDLGSIRSGIAEVVEASALQLETTERTAAELRSAIAAASTGGAVDLTPIVGAVDALRHHYDETQPDLEALVEAMKAMRTQIISGVHEAADANRIDLQPLLDGIEAQRSAQESLLERVRADLAQLETSTHADGDQTRAAIEQVAQAAASPIDLGPVLEAVDAVRASIPRVDLQPVEARLESLAASMSTVELEPILQAIADLRDALPPATDLTPVQHAITDLRDAVPSAADLTPVLDAVAEVGGRVPPPADLEPVRQAIADLAAALPPATDLDPVRDDLASLRLTIGTELDTVRDRIDAVRDSMPTVDLGPIVAAVEALRQEMPTVDLDPVLRAVETVHGDLPTIDLDPVLRAIETVHGDLPTIDLDPLLRAIETVHADLPTVELDPVLDAVETLRRELPEVDLARLHAQLADLASRIDVIDTTVDLGPVHQELDSVRTAVREVEIDLTPVLDGLRDLGRRVDDTTEVERLRAAIDRVADDVAGSRAESARSEMIDQLAQRLDSLQAAVESIRADDALRDTELRLSRRVDANSESLRAKIDDQRALADGLAANVSQLNAALTLASEQPQQLRRDLDRTLEQLAERLGGAMRDLRKELDSAEEPLALRSSVEAGLDRITGRFQTDTSRILEAVAAAQEDADGRLRRIDNQMTELRRAVDRARRETERLEGASPA